MKDKIIIKTENDLSALLNNKNIVVKNFLSIEEAGSFIDTVTSTVAKFENGTFFNSYKEVVFANCILNFFTNIEIGDLNFVNSILYDDKFGDFFDSIINQISKKQLSMLKQRIDENINYEFQIALNKYEKTSDEVLKSIGDFVELGKSIGESILNLLNSVPTDMLSDNSKINQALDMLNLLNKNENIKKIYEIQSKE